MQACMRILAMISLVRCVCVSSRAPTLLKKEWGVRVAIVDRIHYCFMLLLVGFFVETLLYVWVVVSYIGPDVTYCFGYPIESWSTYSSVRGDPGDTITMNIGG